MESGRPPARPARALGAGLAVVALVLLLHALGGDLLLLALAPVAGALVIPGPATLVWRLVVAAGAFAGANALLAFLCGAAGVPYQAPVAAALLLAPPALLVGAGRLQLHTGRWADPGDLVAVAAGLVVLFLLERPAWGADDGHLLALVVGGEDNAAHLGIVNAIARDQRYLFFGGPASRGVFDAYRTYPAGLHLNLALVLNAVEDTLGGGFSERLLQVFHAAGLALQAAWAVTTVMAARAIAGRRDGSLLPTVAVAWAVVLVFAFGPPAATVRFGFQPQAAALWLLTLGVLVAAAPELDGRSHLRLGLLALAFAGTSWCWYLPLPIVGALGLSVLLRLRSELGARPRATLLIVGLAGLGAFPPLYLSLRSGAAGAVNATGGVYALDPRFLLLLLAAGIGLLVASRPPAGSSGRAAALAALGSALLLSGALLAYQVATVGRGGYFYQKSLYTVFMLAVIAAGAGLIALVAARPAPGRWGWRRDAGLLALLMVGAWGTTLLVSTSNPGRFYLEGKSRHPDPPEMRRLLRDGESPGRVEIVWRSNRLPVQDYYASRLASSLSLAESRARLDLVVGSAAEQNPARLLAFVRSTPAGLTIVTRDRLLRQDLLAAGFTEGDLERVRIEVVSGPFDQGPIDHGGDISLRHLLHLLGARGGG